MTYSKHASEGFTLIEIMIAVMIGAIIMAGVIPIAYNQYTKAQFRKAENTIQSLRLAIEQYRVQIGQLPKTLRDLERRPSDPKASKKWRQPFVPDEIGDDPWGERYQYKLTPGGAHPYELYSYGPNGVNAPKEEWISVWDR